MALLDATPTSASRPNSFLSRSGPPFALLNIMENQSPNVLIIDDEKNIRATLSICLESIGCRVVQASSSREALQVLSRQSVELVFLDLRLGEESGLDLLPKLLAEDRSLSIVMITAYATFDTAVEAIKRGAQEYLPKPFTPAQVRHLVERLLSRRAMFHRVSELEQQLAAALPENRFETSSPKMRVLLDTALRAAPSDVPILIGGENGTGKGTLARLLHSRSLRVRGPFVTVNCPTLSEELLASELFGHTRGAFTGAVSEQVGRVESAQGGTLFLDEIVEISIALQAKLLRFLQDKEFERIGETKTRRADVRVIAATNRNLEADVKAGRFREDLFFRLNVIELTMPPLRERPEDILALARHFAAFFAKASNQPTKTLSSSAEEALLSYGWPGNIRELRNTIERATILWPAQVLEPAAFSNRVTEHHTGPRLGGPFTLEEIEREHIQRVIAAAPTLDEAARILGIEPSTLWRKRKKQGEQNK
jgi:NtrC-family two-component system response regulator AlgB